MPSWLSQWSTFVIALILAITFGGVVLSIIVPKVRNAVFYQALGSLVEAATGKSREQDRNARDREHQRSAKAERDQRVAAAVDQLVEGLTGLRSIFRAGYNLKAGGTGQYLTLIHRAISELQREGPDDIQNRLAKITDRLTDTDPFDQAWANGQMTAISTAVRRPKQ